MFVIKPEDFIGKQFGHYQLVEFLKGGGFGLVYKAEHLRLHRTVALKLLKPELILYIPALIPRPAQWKSKPCSLTLFSYRTEKSLNWLYRIHLQALGSPAMYVKALAYERSEDR